VLLYSGREDEKYKEGVGILLSEQASEGLIEWYPVSARIIVAKLKTRFRNITIIQNYAPTEQVDPEVKNMMSSVMPWQTLRNQI
jgi:hypothetical protein